MTLSRDLLVIGCALLLAAGCGPAGDSGLGPDAAPQCEAGELPMNGVCTEVAHLELSISDQVIGQRFQQLRPAWRVPASEPIEDDKTALATEGPCTIYEYSKRDDPPGPQYEDACADIGDIVVAGTLEPVVLENECQVERSFPTLIYRDMPIYEPGASLTFDISGGEDFPQQSITVETPTQFGMELLEIDRTEPGGDYGVTWEAGNADEIQIEVNNDWPHEDFARSILCSVPDTGAFTIPGSLTALLPTYAYPTAIGLRSFERTVELPEQGTILRYVGTSFVVTGLAPIE